MKPKSYQHLTYEQRCQIYTLLKRGESQSAIAQFIGVSQSTVSREMTRNSGKRGYRFKQAHIKACKRRYEASSIPRKLIPSLQVFIEYLLTKKQWSPEQISGWLERIYKKAIISGERIYQHIWQDKARGGALYKHLRRRGKKYNKRGNKLAGRGLIPNRRGIEERPKIVDEKERVGDFEVDTIVGAQHKGSILSIVDRKTKFTFLVLLPRGTADNVTQAMVSALLPIQDYTHTITADNGKEFAQHQIITEQLQANVYFARPYHSWERGLNENTNGLVRQYLPKHTNFATITNQEVSTVQHLLNTRPRKSLNVMTPAEAFHNETGRMIPDYLGIQSLIQKLSA